MLHKVQILLIIFFFLSICGNSQNIIQIDSGITDLNDTITIHIRISNDQPFIAFQCDVLIPESFSFINNSAQLSGREQDHSLTVFEISDTVLRFICFSAQNNFFNGDTGSVMIFRALSGNMTGIFDLKIKDGIIADSMSHNIMDQCINGTWYIGPVGITHKQEFENMTVYPNPGRLEQILINLEMQNQALIELQLFTSDGQLLSDEKLNLPYCRKYLLLRDNVKSRHIDSGMYFLNIKVVLERNDKAYFQKLIIID